MTPPRPSGGSGTGHRRQPAAGQACVPAPVTAPEERAGEVLARIRHQRYASAALIAVCSSDGRLAGLVTIEALLAATPDARMHTLMAPDPVTVTPAMSQEQAATVAAQQAQSAVAVVDPDGRFQGVIPPQRLLNTTRIWLGSAVSSIPLTPPVSPPSRVCLGGCGTGCPGSASAWPVRCSRRG